MLPGAGEPLDHFLRYIGWSDPATIPAEPPSISCVGEGKIMEISWSAWPNATIPECTHWEQKELCRQC